MKRAGRLPNFDAPMSAPDAERRALLQQTPRRYFQGAQRRDACFRPSDATCIQTVQIFQGAIYIFSAFRPDGGPTPLPFHLRTTQPKGDARKSSPENFLNSTDFGLNFNLVIRYRLSVEKSREEISSISFLFLLSR